MNELKYSKQKQIQSNVIDAQEYKAITTKEIDLQRQCESLLQYIPNIQYIRIPDAIYKTIFGNNHVKPYIKRLISSFIKGLPDLIILKKQDDIYCKAVCIELKTAIGKMSQGQRSFAKVVPVIVIRSFEQFEKTLKAFLDED